MYLLDTLGHLRAEDWLEDIKREMGETRRKVKVGTRASGKNSEFDKIKEASIGLIQYLTEG